MTFLRVIDPNKLTFEVVFTFGAIDGANITLPRVTIVFVVKIFETTTDKSGNKSNLLISPDQ